MNSRKNPQLDENGDTVIDANAEADTVFPKSPETLNFRPDEMEENPIHI